MGMSAAHCQGISECLDSGHPVFIRLITLYIALTTFKMSVRQQVRLWCCNST